MLTHNMSLNNMFELHHFRFGFDRAVEAGGTQLDNQQRDRQQYLSTVDDAIRRYPDSIQGDR